MKQYLFRITPGKTPFHVGSAAKDMGFTGKIKDDIYVSPALYPWIHKYFNNEDNNIFAIERPSNMNPLTMCCGINSVYHYVYCHKDLETVNFVKDCVIRKNFKHPRLLKLIDELNEKVKKRFGKTLKQMKGGTYLGTLMDWDKHPVKEGYPEIIMKIKELRSCKWEQLDYVKGDLFVGQKSGNKFKIEFPLDKYGLRYKK